MEAITVLNKSWYSNRLITAGLALKPLAISCFYYIISFYTVLFLSRKVFWGISSQIAMSCIRWAHGTKNMIPPTNLFVQTGLFQLLVQAKQFTSTEQRKSQTIWSRSTAFLTTDGKGILPSTSKLTFIHTSDLSCSSLGGEPCMSRSHLSQRTLRADTHSSHSSKARYTQRLSIRVQWPNRGQKCLLLPSNWPVYGIGQQPMSFHTTAPSKKWIR